MESLFAGKVHAILCRNWKTRIKGRDLYDYIFFLANNATINMQLLKNKLLESGYIKETDEFNMDVLKKMLISRFKEINYTKAKEDVIPFIDNVENLNLWNVDFFSDITMNRI